MVHSGQQRSETMTPQSPIAHTGHCSDCCTPASRQIISKGVPENSISVSSLTLYRITTEFLNCGHSRPYNLLENKRFNTSKCSQTPRQVVHISHRRHSQNVTSLCYFRTSRTYKKRAFKHASDWTREGCSTQTLTQCERKIYGTDRDGATATKNDGGCG